MLVFDLFVGAQEGRKEGNGANALSIPSGVSHNALTAIPASVFTRVALPSASFNPASLASISQFVCLATCLYKWVCAFTEFGHRAAS